MSCLMPRLVCFPTMILGQQALVAELRGSCIEAASVLACYAAREGKLEHA